MGESKAPKKHPAMIGLHDYLSSDGKGSCDPTTLGATPAMRPYLRNRIENAYLAGWHNAAKHWSARVAEIIKKEVDDA